jgi:hypothetical protein
MSSLVSGIPDAFFGQADAAMSKHGQQRMLDSVIGLSRQRTA